MQVAGIRFEYSPVNLTEAPKRDPLICVIFFVTLVPFKLTNKGFYNLDPIFPSSNVKETSIHGAQSSHELLYQLLLN